MLVIFYSFYPYLRCKTVRAFCVVSLHVCVFVSDTFGLWEYEMLSRDQFALPQTVIVMRFSGRRILPDSCCPQSWWTVGTMRAACNKRPRNGCRVYIYRLQRGRAEHELRLWQGSNPVKDSNMAALSETKQLRTENAKLESNFEEQWKLAKARDIRILEIEQCSRNANIEIEGLPRTPNENITGMLEKLCRAVWLQITADDTKVCHGVPVPKSTVNHNKIVHFVHRKNCNTGLENWRKMRLSANDPVFDTIHLCKWMSTYAPTWIDYLARWLPGKEGVN